MTEPEKTNDAAGRLHAGAGGQGGRNTVKNERADQCIPGAAYTEFAAEIAHYNLTALQQISFVGMIGGLLLLIASLPAIRLLTLMEGYAAIAVLFSAVFVLTVTVLKRHKRAVLPVYYGFITLVLLIAIVMGTLLGRDTNATTFVMLVMVLPMLIIDRPYRLHLLLGLLSAVFCIVDCHSKSGRLLDLDLANCIVFYLLSVIISRQTIRAKMSDIIIKSELKRQRDVDMLTKLNNRGSFERIVAGYMHESNKNAVLMIMDIDNFKSVNDTLGHAYGDMVLQLVGEYLQSAFRSGDTVSRLGGDEFVAFLPAVEDMDVITERVEQLIARIGAIRIESEPPCRIGASAGLARYPENGCSFEALYQRADEALYRAKQSGRGRYVIYESPAQARA